MRYSVRRKKKNPFQEFLLWIFSRNSDYSCYLQKCVNNAIYVYISVYLYIYIYMHIHTYIWHHQWFLFVWFFFISKKEGFLLEVRMTSASVTKLLLGFSQTELESSDQVAWFCEVFQKEITNSKLAPSHLAGWGIWKRGQAGYGLILSARGSWLFSELP